MMMMMMMMMMMTFADPFLFGLGDCLNAQKHFLIHIINIINHRLIVVVKVLIGGAPDPET